MLCDWHFPPSHIGGSRATLAACACVKVHEVRSEAVCLCKHRHSCAIESGVAVV